VHNYDLWRFAQIAISIPDPCKGLTSDRMHDQWNNAYKLARGSRLTSLTISYISYTRSAAYKSVRGSRLTSLTISYTFHIRSIVYKKQGALDRRSIQLLLLLTYASQRTKSKWLPIDALYSFYYFQHTHRRVQKVRGSLGMRFRFSIWLTKFSKVFAAQQISPSMVWLDP
jgi:hypothetical protein